MNNYDERITHIKESLVQELDMYELTVVTNKGVGLYVEIETDSFTQTIPPLRGEIDEQAVAKLQSYKEEMTLLLQRIVTEKIGNGFEKLFSEYMAEELKNPRIQTIKKILLAREFEELKGLFLSINSHLS